MVGRSPQVDKACFKKAIGAISGLLTVSLKPCTPGLVRMHPEKCFELSLMPCRIIHHDELSHAPVSRLRYGP